MALDMLIANEDLQRLLNLELKNDKLYLVKDNKGNYFIEAEVLLSEKQALMKLSEFILTISSSSNAS